MRSEAEFEIRQVPPDQNRRSIRRSFFRKTRFLSVALSPLRRRFDLSDIVTRLSWQARMMQHAVTQTSVKKGEALASLALF